MYVNIHELQVSASTILFGILLRPASLRSQEKKREKEREKRRKRKKERSKSRYGGRCPLMVTSSLLRFMKGKTNKRKGECHRRTLFFFIYIFFVFYIMNNKIMQQCNCICLFISLRLIIYTERNI